MKPAYFPESADREGVDVTFYRKPGTISIGGWYDSIVGIENTMISLREFFNRVGITRQDCEKAFRS